MESQGHQRLSLGIMFLIMLNIQVIGPKKLLGESFFDSFKDSKSYYIFLVSMFSSSLKWQFRSSLLWNFLTSYGLGRLSCFPLHRKVYKPLGSIPCVIPNWLPVWTWTSPSPSAIERCLPFPPKENHSCQERQVPVSYLADLFFHSPPVPALLPGMH